MALFGRWSARQRLRSAARDSLAIPAFSTPVDCSSWVLGGLWPAELATITPETAPLADYLHADLQRIAQSANEKLYALGRSDLAASARQIAQARVINVARAFAVLRVESTVRQLHKETLDFGGDFARLSQGPVPVSAAREVQVEPGAASPVTAPPGDAGESAGLGAQDHPPAPRVSEEIVIATEEHQQTAAPVLRAEAVVEIPGDPTVTSEFTPSGLLAMHRARTTQPDSAAPPPTPLFAESDEQRAQRLLGFVARQEPGLRWGVGVLADGSTLLVTDIAHGWIPPGVELPAGVQLLKPGWRTGTLTEMLGGPLVSSAVYSPGNRLGRASDSAVPEVSAEPRKLAPIEDLGWQLSGATHWRDGLPRMVNTLAKAGAAGTGVVEAEIDLLRVHLDTMRYQLLARYPDSDTAAVLNLMLLAATEGIATGDLVSANYHFSWYRALSVPPAAQWDVST
ncbi:hypothetical protein AWC02_14825 [Mycolicibacter engbaekii]|uniref:Vegetative cell wall protein n=1 Tax=Mycolicibacter engbaekii TaxID=188915 RepID=A0A1X1TJ66_9MYCO|nr:DUF5631 domain-containing protein [Mycolicibacter engbaekii]ORV44624.1 hypothetical protein AWC02_14825 [Mycolicibacter engbaekii]